jgi:purine-nucleoside phosphorylase
MVDLPSRIAEAVAAIRAASDLIPTTGIVLGTGLGDLSGVIESPTAIPYEDVPHLPAVGVESHAGQLVLGTVRGTPVVAMRGRAHFYEGYSMQEVTFGVRVMKALGAANLILSSAVGGMNPLHPLGSIVVVDDHINLMGDNPLIGPNHDELGPRFPDMSEPYSRELQAMVSEVALEERIRVERGVLVCVAGPNLETRAEYRFLRAIGADVVGMSMVPEAIVAVHAGMRVLGFTVVTDRCLPDALEPVDVPKILATAAKAEPLLTRLVAGTLARLG